MIKNIPTIYIITLENDVITMQPPMLGLLPNMGKMNEYYTTLLNDIGDWFNNYTEEGLMAFPYAKKNGVSCTVDTTEFVIKMDNEEHFIAALFLCDDGTKFYHAPTISTSAFFKDDGTYIDID